jgi:hypothetical protein
MIDVTYSPGEVYEGMFRHCEALVAEFGPELRRQYPDGADSVLLVHYLSQSRRSGRAPDREKARKLARFLGIKLSEMKKHRDTVIR